MSIQVEFGRCVKMKRSERKWTQSKIAEMIDVDVRHVHNIEYGETELGLRTAVALANIFDIDLNQLKEFAVHDTENRYLKEYDTNGCADI